jgi:hypothetical protein
MNADAKPYAVYCIKDDGRRAEFNRYASRDEAEHIVASLGQFGCRAEVAELVGGDAQTAGATTCPAGS